ncbi:hypothetical protein [Synechocystis sp. PCC 6714]|uniref:hypothetical protein n=1 Tax=Synechocystis sp. (strain PCC 6714) TaxID=1147 RepID=UPI00118736AC|nr:hypothetical protein [Synechocystis sp. PCC 6714]
MFKLKKFGKNMTLYDSAHSLYHELLLQSYDELKKAISGHTFGRNDCLRLATIVCSNCYHFREHLKEGYGYDFSIDYLRERCEDYILARDITNLTKHYKLTNYTPLISNPNDIYEYLHITLYEDAKGQYRHHQIKVSVKLTTGVKKDVLSIITNVLNMWTEILVSQGILNKSIYFNYINKIFFSRDEANKNLPLLKIKQGVRSAPIIAFSQYDYESNTLKSVDIKDFKMRIYEKPNNTIIDYSLDIKDKTFTDFVELTDQEQGELIMLADDIDIENFIEKIAKKYNIYEKIRINAICTDKVKQIKLIKTFFRIDEFDDKIDIDFVISFPDIDMILEKKYTLNLEEKTQFEYSKLIGLEGQFLSKLAEKYDIYNQIFSDNLEIFITDDGIELGFSIHFDKNDKWFKLVEANGQNKI